MGVLWEVSYQISPKFRTKLASVAEVFSTLSTKCSAQHAQLIHLGRVESVFAQRIEQLMPILLLLSKHPFVVKTCHLAHRFSQTYIPSLSGLCGAVRGSSAGVHEFKLTWPLQVNTAALTALSGAFLSWFRRLSIVFNQMRFHLGIKSWGVRLAWVDIGGSNGWMYFTLCHPIGTSEMRPCQSLTYAQQKN